MTSKYKYGYSKLKAFIKLELFQLILMNWIFGEKMVEMFWLDKIKTFLFIT